MMQDLALLPKNNGRWNQKEHMRFLKALNMFGKEWKKFEKLIPTRNGTQIRSHAQKYFMKKRLANQMNKSEETTQYEMELESDDAINFQTPREISLIKQDSYYLKKILQFTNDNSSFDFWQYLIDTKNSCMDTISLNNKNGFSLVECEILHKNSRKIKKTNLVSIVQ